MHVTQRTIKPVIILGEFVLSHSEFTFYIFLPTCPMKGEVLLGSLRFLPFPPDVAQPEVKV
jgi:hypothetical protein